VITWLETHDISGQEPSAVGGPDHPMRLMTHRAAGLAGDPWDADARAQVAGSFDALAPVWHTRTSPGRAEVVADALERGVPTDHDRGLVVEVGSGIGAYSSLLAARWRTALAVELSREMARLAPAGPAVRVLADGSVLPLATGVADAVVLVNMFLFPAEVARVLRPDGYVVWVNSSGEHTPIHLMPEQVEAALPGSWSGVAARAGSGLWAVLRRV
jgi:SAM-dependent methyltransferase